MSFQDESVEAFDAMLEMMSENTATGCCSFRWPVNRDGTDKSGADDYDCIPSPTPDRLELIAGGYLSDYQFSMSARRDDFETLPISGDLFIKGGRVTRILNPEVSELSGLVVFHCGSPDK